MTEDGFLIIPRLLAENDCVALGAAIDSAMREGSKVRTVSANRRNLLREVPVVADLGCSAALRALASEHTGGPAFLVRALLFDKTPEANWSVGWHQDVTIAVRARREVGGFSGWSIKDGVHHVQPPAEVLAHMVILRLHLDDCFAENGALRVLPGSHRPGKLDDAQLARWCESTVPVTCEVPRGGAVLMRPLLLHASSRATKPARRRVIHFDYASQGLPGGLEWHARPEATAA